MAARNHHFVSQGYLRGFVADRKTPVLYVIDSETGEEFTTNPRNVAAVRDFHTINVEGKAPDTVETELGKFEGEASAALERIIAARSIANQEDLSYVIALMAMFAAKNPARRENWRQFEGQVHKMTLELATATLERWASQVRQAGLDKLPGEKVSYEEIRKFVREDKFDIKLATEHHLGLEFESWGTLTEFLARRYWTLLRAAPGVTGFVTSDHPVCLQWSDPKMVGGFHGPGFGLKNTEVTFPVSNELALLGTFERPPVEIDVDEPLVGHVNKIIMMHAQRQVYARANDFAYVSAIDGSLKRGAELLTDPAFRGSKQTAGTDAL